MLENSPKQRRHPALAYRDFTLMLFSRLCGTVGAQMLSVAIGWQVYDLTGDPFTLGMVGLCQFLPALLLVLHAGQFADMLDRARLNAASYVLVTLCATTLCLVSLTDAPQVWWFYALSVIIGMARIIGAPATKALLPNLVPAAAFSNAISLSSLGFQIGTISGPALGGAAYSFGAPVVYGIAAALMGMAALTGLMISTRSKGVKQPLNWPNLIAGVHYIRAHPMLLGVISLDLFAVLFGGAVALLPIYAKDILQTGPLGLGFLRAAPAGGAAIMAIALAYFPLQRRVGRWMFGAVAVFGLTTIAFGLSTSFPLSLALLLVLGAADMISVFVRSHLVQLATPDHLRGRVASVNMLFITTSNELGEFESGLTASWFGVVPATILGGLLTLGVVGVCIWRVPSLYQVDTLSTAADHKG
jgi:MFS family permease